MSPARVLPDQSTYSGRLAARIRELRDKAGLSVPEVVAAMSANGYEMKAVTYYQWESSRTQPNFDALPALAAALRTKVRTLVPAE